MHSPVIRRAASLAAALLIVVGGSALADTLGADGDVLDPGVQTMVDLGTTAPGATRTASIAFELTCAGYSHVDPGQVVTVNLGSSIVPLGGAAEATPASLGPVPAGWAIDGEGCQSATTVRSDPSTVTLRAPTDPGTYDYTLSFQRTLAPVGDRDSAAFTGGTALTLRLSVVADQPPTLTLPTDLTVEATSAAGAVATWTASATDAEDALPPPVTCDPASGGVFPLGLTTVTCSTTDSAGHQVTGSFTVTVLDTTPPAWVALPGSVAQTTTDPAGAAAAYALPAALDAVDPAPAVACLPSPGTWIPVGTTTIVCTATDGTGNAASAAIPLTLAYQAPTTVSARFEPPVRAGGTTIVTPGRSLPVKVRLLRDGRPVDGGRVDLAFSACAGGPSLATVRPPVAMTSRAGRWMIELGTAGMAGCVRADLRLDGRSVDGFDIVAGGPVGRSVSQGRSGIGAGMSDRR
jgi:hypothetical protein